MSQRKVVRYDNDLEGDRLELPGSDGHGTEVAGVMLGQLSSEEESEADGVAKGAKIHVYDIKKGAGTYCLIFLIPDALSAYSCKCIFIMDIDVLFPTIIPNRCILICEY